MRAGLRAEKASLSQVCMFQILSSAPLSTAQTRRPFFGRTRWAGNRSGLVLILQNAFENIPAFPDPRHQEKHIGSGI